MTSQPKQESEESKLGQLATHSAHQVWLAGLGALAKAHTEGTKLFDALVKEGEALQARATRDAHEQITEMSKAVSGPWDKLEHVLEERIAVSLKKLGVPTNADIQTLSDHINQLNATVQQLFASTKRPKLPARRPVRSTQKPRRPSPA